MKEENFCKFILDIINFEISRYDFLLKNEFDSLFKNDILNDIMKNILSKIIILFNVVKIVDVNYFVFKLVKGSGVYFLNVNNDRR